MSFWGSVFGTKKVIDKTVDGIYNGLDNVVYTPQEKAEMRQRSLDRHERLLGLYEPFKKMQRVVAMAVLLPYMSIHTIAAIAFMFGLFIDSGETMREASGALATFNNESLGTPFSLIIGFYFAGGAIEGIVRKYKGG